MPKVLKIGGSNLHDVNSLRSIAALVRQYDKPVFLVVSAFNGLTDQLYHLIRQPVSKEAADLLIRQLREKYGSMLAADLTDTALLDRTLQGLDERLRRLNDLLQGSSLIGGVPDFVEDEVVSFGERISSLILTAYLNEQGLPTDELLPEDIGFYTDGTFHNATMDFSTPINDLASLDPDKHYVMPGFYGIDRARRITVFGRGGSDYSAACLAALLQAESLDVWKDVDGYLSGDPLRVKAPRRISRLSYREAAELSYFGARILHPRTVEPLKPRNIPIRIFNFSQAGQHLEPFTVIGQAYPDEGIKSVTCTEGVRTLTLRGAAVGITPGILSKVTHQLEINRLNINSVITTQIAISLLLDAGVTDQARDLIRELKIAGVEDLDTSPELCLIAAVGEGVLTQPGIAARIFSAVAQCGINIRFISFGASRVAIYFLVDLPDKDEALHAIHTELFS